MIDTMMLAKLNAILNKANFDDEEIARGLRLKDSGMTKLASMLRISPQDASELLNQLITKLRKDQKTVEESYQSILGESSSRYGMEKDRLGNVTVRDSHSGKEVFLRGSAATDVLNAVKRGNEQEVLAQALSESINEGAGDDEDSYADEIRQDRGSYNFPWTYERQQGTGTADYTGRGDSFKIKIVSIRDQSGEEIEADEAMTSALSSQAFKFIGHA